MTILEGPAGTGKTKVGAYFAGEYVKIGKRVLMAAMTKTGTQSLAREYINFLNSQELNFR